MRKFTGLLLAPALLLCMGIAVAGLVSCSGEQGEDGEVLARINDFSLTYEEFKKQLAEDLAYNPESTLDEPFRKEFLERLVRKELLIQEASRLNLDRREEFIRAIERYWESTLIRDLLALKSEEIKKSTLVSDAEVRARYQDRVVQNPDTPPLEELRDEITAELAREKETRALDEWIESLKDGAEIVVDEELLHKD